MSTFHTIPSQIDKTILLNGTDITEYVISLPTLPNTKPWWGELPTPSTLDIEVASIGRIFDQIHPASILYGLELTQKTLVVKYLGITLWSGYISEVRSDLGAQRATITGESIFQQKINRKARVDTDLISPAEIAERILALHDIAIDAASFDAAKAILDDIPVRARANPSVLSWLGTLGDLLRLIASAGVGRYFFTPSGAVGFNTWVDETNPTPLHYIKDVDLMAPPIVEEVSMDRMDSYSVKWLYGTTSNTGDESMTSMDFSGQNAITVMDAASALYIGTQWVALSNKMYYKLTLPIHKAYATQVSLNDYLHLQSDRYGISAVFEIVEIDDGDPKWVTLTLHSDKTIFGA